MFLDNLSTSVLKLCDTRKLSYEAASERCDLSSRYFADIARGKTAPTILTLEKLCVGFALTPNDLLIPSELWREMAFREPMPVTHIRCFRYLSGVTGFPFVRNVEGPWNGNTSPTVTAADSALTGTTSLKQRLFFLRSNAHCYIPDYPASGLYLLAAFGMPFFSPQFFFISLLTFYLQTSEQTGPVPPAGTAPPIGTAAPHPLAPATPSRTR